VIDVLIAVATTAAIFLVAGAPFALSIRSRTEGWLPLLTDAAGFGLIVVPLAIVAWDLFGAGGIVLAALVLVAFGVLALRSRVGLPTRQAKAPLSLVLLWIAVGVIAVVLRLHNTNFLPWVGDMGAYVNWSNEFVRTGELAATWPPVYSSFLSLSTAIFGTDGTAAGIAVTGLVLIAVIARVLTLLRVNRWVVVGIAAAVAFNVHAIWYSTFPSSESLNAPVFLIWAAMLIVTIKAPREQLAAALGLTFIVMLHLCLLRGSGSFLLAPALLAAVVSIVLPAWRAWSARIWMFFLATLIAAEVGVWYGVSVIPRYFVDMQLRMLAPGSLFAWGKEIGLFSPGPLLLGILVLMTGLVALGLAFALRHPTADPVKGARATRVLAYISAGALLAVIVLAGVVGSNIWFIFWRSGMWIPAAAIVALVVIARRKRVLDDTPVVFLLIATSLMLIAFHSFRVGNDRVHAFFTYWDRYLYSEVIPALFVVGGLGISAVVAWVAARENRKLVLAPVAATLIGVAVVTVPHSVAIARISQDTYMAGAYDFTVRLGEATKPSDPTLWGATSDDAAPGFFFPNTWMAFAVPLQRSFGYQFDNVTQGDFNFAPDDVVTSLELYRALDKAAGDTVYVYETQTGVGRPLDERLASNLHATQIAEETSNISLLQQERTLADWTHAKITVIVWAVTRDSE